MRTAQITRKTKETDITLSVDLDGKGNVSINTGIGFFDHMLTALAVHSGVDMDVICKGDLNVDGHPSVEDIGICLGKAFVPMDESLAFCSLDISGRALLVFDADFTNEMIGEFDTCLTEEFFRAFAFNAGITLHIKQEYGKNDHHIAEAIFKAVAHALRQAIAINGNTVLSTKGVL